MKTNWQTKKLGEVAKLLKGKRPKKLLLEGEAPYLTAKVIRKQEEPLYAEVTDINFIPVTKNDLVIIMDGSNSGEIFTNIAGALSSTMGKIEYNKELLFGKYLLYFLRVHRGVFTKSKTGSAIPHLNKEQFENLVIPIPSLVNQKRIVKKLDKILGDIDKVKENTKKNLQNSYELFRSYVSITFRNQGWNKKSLSEICDNLDNQRVPITKKDRVSGPYPYYGASGQVDQVNDYLFDEDLLLISEDGANLLARTYPIAFSISGKSWVNNHAHVLRFENKFTQKFVQYYVNSINISKYVSGMAQPKLNQTVLNSIQVPIPSVEEQKMIAKKLDLLTRETKRLQKNYLQKLRLLEELKKSVLAKVFAGEL